MFPPPFRLPFPGRTLPYMFPTAASNLPLPNHNFLASNGVNGVPSQQLPSPAKLHKTASSSSVGKVVHRKKCRHPKTAADVAHRYCHVCNAKAENYNFGVISCESCKAFFRRNAHKVIGGVVRDMGCSFEHGRCEISPATRKRCPGCRLTKCFSVGMRADLIQKAECRPPEVFLQDSDSSSSQRPPPQTPSSSFPVNVSSIKCEIQSPRASTSDISSEKSPPDVPLLSSCASPASLYDHVKGASAPVVCLSLLNMMRELTDLVSQCILGNLDSQGGSGFSGLTSISMIRLFVGTSSEFVNSLPELSRYLTQSYLIHLTNCQLHTVVFPLSCAAFDRTQRRFKFTVNGYRIEGHPLEGICESKGHDPRLAHLKRYHTYLKHLIDITDLRHDLLAFFCSMKFLHLQSEEALNCESLRTKSSRLLELYIKHFNGALFYYFPFDYEQRMQMSLKLLKWSVDFDESLRNLLLVLDIMTPPVKDEFYTSPTSSFFSPNHS